MYTSYVIKTETKAHAGKSTKHGLNFLQLRNRTIVIGYGNRKKNRLKIVNFIWNQRHCDVIILYFRSNVHLHLFQCPNKAIKCPVTGCNNFFKRGKQLVHDMNHAESHQAQLKAEVEKLRCAIFDKVCTLHKFS